MEMERGSDELSLAVRGDVSCRESAAVPAVPPWSSSGKTRRGLLPSDSGTESSGLGACEGSHKRVTTWRGRIRLDKRCFYGNRGGDWNVEKSRVVHDC